MLDVNSCRSGWVLLRAQDVVSWLQGELPKMVSSLKKSHNKLRCADARSRNSTWNKIKMSGATLATKGDVSLVSKYWVFGSAATISPVSSCHLWACANLLWSNYKPLFCFFLFLAEQQYSVKHFDTTWTFLALNHLISLRKCAQQHNSVALAFLYNLRRVQMHVMIVTCGYS